MAKKAKTSKAIKVSVSRVETRHWGPDDDYNVVPEFQVFEEEFPRRTPVRITVERITEKEYDDFFKEK